MPWFKVDDNFSLHPKVIDAGNAAVGLWVRCGAWSAAHRTEGHIPTKVAYQFGSKKEIDTLLAARLWEIADSTGFTMPDFLQYNPSKEEDEQRRQRERERKADWRARRHLGLVPGQTMGRDA